MMSAYVFSGNTSCCSLNVFSVFLVRGFQTVTTKSNILYKMSCECDAAITIALVILYALVLISLFNKNLLAGLEDTIPIRAKRDNLVYNVNKNLKDPEQAAEIMAEINQRLIKLAKHIKKKYGLN